MSRAATPKEIRQFYKNNGHEVRIARDGKVSFKKDGDEPWLDGRWVSEYVTNEGETYLK